MQKLTKEFFLQDTLTVAKQLIGKQINFDFPQEKFRGIITETEGYFGDDAASHGARGKTMRNDAMFYEGGITYIYLIYGIYHCLNFVTEKENYPSAVLIRGINLFSPHEKNLDGPGKICKYFGLTKEHNKINICEGNLISIYNIDFSPKIHTTKRIGITKNAEKPWRFFTNEIKK